MYKPGDVVRLKSTGDQVTVVTVAEFEQAPIGIRCKSKDGHFYVQSILPIEVETVRENILREFEEMRFKNKLMSDFAEEVAAAEQEPFKPVTPTKAN